MPSQPIRQLPTSSVHLPVTEAAFPSPDGASPGITRFQYYYAKILAGAAQEVIRFSTTIGEDDDQRKTMKFASNAAVVSLIMAKFAVENEDAFDDVADRAASKMRGPGQGAGQAE